jgi:hypothetical protein
MSYQKVCTHEEQQQHPDAAAAADDDDEISIMSLEQQVYLESLEVLSDIEDHEALMRETLETPPASPYANSARVLSATSTSRNYAESPGFSPAVFGSSPPFVHQQQQHQHQRYHSPSRTTKYRRGASNNNTYPPLSPMLMMDDSSDNADFDGFYRNNPETVAHLVLRKETHADFDTPEFKAYRCVRYLRQHKRRVWLIFGLVVLGCCLPVVVRIAYFQPDLVADTSSFRKRSIHTKNRIAGASHHAAKKPILTTGDNHDEKQPLLKANETAAAPTMLLASNNATAATTPNAKPGLKKP